MHFWSVCMCVCMSVYMYCLYTCMFMSYRPIDIVFCLVYKFDKLIQDNPFTAIINMMGLPESTLFTLSVCILCSEKCLYRAMHFSAIRGIAISCRLSVHPSVCPSVTLVNCDHIGWNSSKIISPLVNMGCSLFATPT